MYFCDIVKPLSFINVGVKRRYKLVGVHVNPTFGYSHNFITLISKIYMFWDGNQNNNFWKKD